MPVPIYQLCMAFRKELTIAVETRRKWRWEWSENSFERGSCFHSSSGTRGGGGGGGLRRTRGFTQSQVTLCVWGRFTVYDYTYIYMQLYTWNVLRQLGGCTSISGVKKKVGHRISCWIMCQLQGSWQQSQSQERNIDHSTTAKGVYPLCAPKNCMFYHIAFQNIDFVTYFRKHCNEIARDGCILYTCLFVHCMMGVKKQTTKKQKRNDILGAYPCL